MNEQLQNTVNQILQGAISQATAGAEFLNDQIPDVLQQLLMWHLTSSIVQTVIAVIGLWVCYMAAFKWSDQKKDSWGDWSASKGTSIVIGGILSLFLVVGGLASFFTALKIAIAPKVWLLEYAAALVKNG